MANQDVIVESTAAIETYDGIFKSLYDEDLRNMFQEARRTLKKGDWNAGKDAFLQMLQRADDNPRDKKTVQELVNEIERFEKYHIPENTAVAPSINWAEIADRPLERLDESLFGLCQGVFYLTIGCPGKPGFVRLVGQKLLSDLFVDFRIPELYCSLVTADMLLGLFVDERLSDSKITMFYNPINKSEKIRVMNDIMASGGANVELVFPFPIMRQSTRQEWGSPPEGWQVDDAYDVMLSCGEERIRAYSIKFLKDANLEKPILYDPACSTGVFLSTLQKAIPGSYTVGQDLSQQMANFAKERVDEAHCANALFPKIKLGTADVVYIRFLNSEVVMTREAEELLSALLSTVKVGGYVVTFGHTPVLLSSSNFLALEGFQLAQCVGVDVNRGGIFQYYVIKRKV